MVSYLIYKGIQLVRDTRAAQLVKGIVIKGINWVNSLDYGLTSGLQSLDEGEQKLWKDSIMAGNLYINRGITCLLYTSL